MFVCIQFPKLAKLRAFLLFQEVPISESEQLTRISQFLFFSGQESTAIVRKCFFPPLRLNNCQATGTGTGPGIGDWGLGWGWGMWNGKWEWEIGNGKMGMEIE